MQLPDSCFAIRKKSIDKPSVLPILATRVITMNNISPQTRKFVKPKSGNNVALFTSANLQLEVSAEEIIGKPAQDKDLQKSDPGAREHFELQKDIGVIPPGRKANRTSLIARYILGIIAAKVGYGCWGPLAEETIAREARCGLWPVKNAKKQLEAAGLLDVNRKGKCHRYYVPMMLRRVVKTWVNPSLVRDDGLSIAQAVWVSLVKFRQGQNEETWLTHREAAEILGVSYPTIYRAAASCAALGYVQKTHRPWRRSWKNEYRLTCKADEATGVFGLESARSNARALGQTNREGGYFKANSVRNGSFCAGLGLSFDCRPDREPYELLVRYGVNRFVARAIAVQWRDYPDSVRNAIVNGIIRRDDYCRRYRRLGLPAPPFNLAGYIVASLNGAHRECHRVPPSKLARADKARQQRRAPAAAGGVEKELEFEKLQQYAENVLEPILAKNPTPGKSAIPAQNRLFHDKNAVSAWIKSVEASARGRSWQCWKHANLGQKLDFPVDS
ncbi:hypothetical protein ES703_34152 [subsurface metagenome]